MLQRIMSILEYFPSTLLGNWILFLAGTGYFNTAHCYATPFKINREIYSLEIKDVTRLAARLYGTWTLLSAILRTYCCYRLYDQTAYILTMITFAITTCHFTSEWMVFKTIKVNKSCFLALTAPPFTLAWMLLAYPFYFE